MSYTPTEWNTGDIISSEKLNKLEAGVEQAIELPDTTGASDGDVLTLDNGEPAWAAPSGGGTFIVEAALVQGSLAVDKTYEEIEAAFDAGLPIIANLDAGLLSGVAQLSSVGEDAFVFTGSSIGTVSGGTALVGIAELRVNTNPENNRLIIASISGSVVIDTDS